MKESNVTNDDARKDEMELEPSILGQVSEVTGSSPTGGSDRDTIVWSDLD